MVQMHKICKRIACAQYASLEKQIGLLGVIYPTSVAESLGSN